MLQHSKLIAKPTDNNPRIIDTTKISGLCHIENISKYINFADNKTYDGLITITKTPARSKQAKYYLTLLIFEANSVGDKQIEYQEYISSDTPIKIK